MSKCMKECLRKDYKSGYSQIIERDEEKYFSSLWWLLFERNIVREWEIVAMGVRCGVFEVMGEERGDMMFLISIGNWLWGWENMDKSEFV